MPISKGFDWDGYFNALAGVVSSRALTWKQVAGETGVSQSTLTRMSKGRRPDASSLAALSAWSGLNPSDFVDAPFKSARADSMSQIAVLLRNDPELNREGAATVEAIVRAAYENLRKASE